VQAHPSSSQTHTSQVHALPQHEHGAPTSDVEKATAIGSNPTKTMTTTAAMIFPLIADLLA
jgi:hypothetical protein